MRRWLGALLVLILLVPAVAALANTESIRDDFKAISYSGNDGTMDWAGPWVEEDDTGGPGSGQIRVVDDDCANYCLLMEGGLLQTLKVSRQANLSGFADPELTFDVDIDPAPLSTGRLSVDVRGKGSGWVNLDSFQFNLLLGSREPLEGTPYDISEYAGADFELRFVISGLGLLGVDRVYIDRVTIMGKVEPTTTTTSTTSTSTTTSTTSTSTTQPEPTTTSTPKSTASSTNTTTATQGTTTTTNPVSAAGETSTTTTTDSGSGPGDVVGETTTTTVDRTTTTTRVTDSAGALVDDDTPPSDGLREPAIGLVADYRPGMMGDMDFDGVEVLSAELEADFSMAVEVFQTAKIWIAILVLLITATVISGMDSRRTMNRA